MAFTIRDGLDPALLPLAWLIGHWEGSGNGLGPQGEFAYSVTVDFAESGGNWLHYLMQWFATDSEGLPQHLIGIETGFWRPAADGSVEALIAQPEGVVEVYVGHFEPGRIELATDLVARTVTAQVTTTGGHRLYGNVESDLMFTYDRGTADDDLQPYLWARLQRR